MHLFSDPNIMIATMLMNGRFLIIFVVRNIVRNSLLARAKHLLFIHIGVSRVFRLETRHSQIVCIIKDIEKLEELLRGQINIFCRYENKQTC